MRTDQFWKRVVQLLRDSPPRMQTESSRQAHKGWPLDSMLHNTITPDPKTLISLIGNSLSKIRIVSFITGVTT